LGAELRLDRATELRARRRGLAGRDGGRLAAGPEGWVALGAWWVGVRWWWREGEVGSPPARPRARRQDAYPLRAPGSPRVAPRAPSTTRRARPQVDVDTPRARRL